MWTVKFPKIVIFCGISKRYKTSLIGADKEA
jgi:hypothetical protein